MYVHDHFAFKRICGWRLTSRRARSGAAGGRSESHRGGASRDAAAAHGARAAAGGRGAAGNEHESCFFFTEALSYVFPTLLPSPSHLPLISLSTFLSPSPLLSSLHPSSLLPPFFPPLPPVFPPLSLSPILPNTPPPRKRKEEGKKERAIAKDRISAN